MAPRKTAKSKQLDLVEAPAPVAPPPVAPPEPSGRLTISRLTVHRTLGVEESTIDLGTITVLSGGNASGKTSHLRAMRSALGIDRVSLARLAMVGDDDTEEPAVDVLLVGEGREVLVSRKAGGSPEVRERVGEDWRKVARSPVEWLRELVDVEAASPAVWLASDDETRAAAVLAAMPLEGYRREDALKAAGLDAFRLPPIPAGLHPLEDLEQIEGAVFAARTEVNRQERSEADAAAKLLAGLPAAPPVDIAQAVLDLEAQASELGAEVARDAEAIESTERAARSTCTATTEGARERAAAAFREGAAAYRAECERQVSEIRAEAERRVSDLLMATEGQVASLKAKAEAELEAACERAEAARDESLAAAKDARLGLEARQADLHALRERLAGMRETQRSIDTDRHVRATAEQALGKARDHASRSAALTAGIAAIRRYRLDLAGRLPIKGLAVAYDDKGRKSLTLDGIPLSQVNQGRLFELATDVSLLRSAPPADGRPYLPVVLLDGIEALDAQARVSLLREVAARGAQVVAACVTTGPLRALCGDEAISEFGGAGQ